MDFQKERLRLERGDNFLFRTVIKISKIQFSQFLHTSASKFSHGRLPNHSLLPAEFEFLFYIVLLRSKILVLFSWDFPAGNSKFSGPTLSDRSGTQFLGLKSDIIVTLSYDTYTNGYPHWPTPLHPSLRACF